MTQVEVKGRVIPGYQIASGQTEDSPYPDGSIVLQKRHFKSRGLDLSQCYNGTLNLDIAPKSFRMVSPLWTFEKVDWIKGFPPETFSFASCTVVFNCERTVGYVYYPHPETKTRHFHSVQRLEILAPFIKGIKYGDSVTLLYDSQQIYVG